VEDELKPGEIRISGAGRPKGKSGWVVILILFSLFLWGVLRPGRPEAAVPAVGAGNISQGNQSLVRAAFLTFCGEDGSPGDANCLPSAPRLPGQLAYITYRADEQTSFVIGATWVRVHVVDELPASVRDTGVVVRRGVAGADAAASGRPLIFDGDVDIGVGPLVDRDQMLAMVALGNSNVREVESLYMPTRPRGPPPGRPLDVYILGMVQHFRGPDQRDYSALQAAVFDMRLDASLESLDAHNRDVINWERLVAERAGVPESALAGVTSNDGAHRAVAQHIKALRPDLLRDHGLPDRPAERFRVPEHLELPHIPLR
jgi:hypothetical protein